MSLVRVRLTNGRETNVGANWAEINGLEVLDEPTHRGDGTPRRATRKAGRPVKPRRDLRPVEVEEHNPENGGADESAPTAEEATE